MSQPKEEIAKKTYIEERVDRLLKEIEAEDPNTRVDLDEDDEAQDNSESP